MTATATIAPIAAKADPAIRATAKGHRAAGLDLSQPFLFRGYSTDVPDADGTRYERFESRRGGVYGIKVDGDRVWLGGVATKFWLSPAFGPAPEPTQAEVELATFQAAYQVEVDAFKAAGLPITHGAMKQAHERAEAALAAAAEPAPEAPAAPVAPALAGQALIEGLAQMTFAQVMELAKAYRVKGRGTARIEALRAGVAEAVRSAAA